MAVDGKGERKNQGKAPVELLPLSYILLNCPDQKGKSVIRQFRKLANWFYKGYSSNSLKSILRDLNFYYGISFDEIAQVLAKGAEKYAPRNWERGMKWSICYASASRHMLATLEVPNPALGLENTTHDKESGLPHLWHFACNVMFLLEYSKTCPELDDRPRSK